MKDSWEWREVDLIDLIANAVPESLTLDYKASDALVNSDPKKNEISKDVSAFANSAGGVVVYGIREQGHLPESLDGGVDPSITTREWIEQVINSRIHRRIPGVRINQVILRGARAGRVAYVVDVPQSHLAPHMASDNKYYRRHNFQAVPMEEYEVRDVSQRSAGPSLRLELELDSARQPLQFTAGQPNSAPVALQVRVRNQVARPAEYAVMAVGVDTRLSVTSNGEFRQHKDMRAIVDGVPALVRLHILNWGVPGKMPIWEDMPFRVSDPPLMVAVPSGIGRFHLYWQVGAPGMATRVGGYVLTTDGNSASLLEAS